MTSATAALSVVAAVAACSNGAGESVRYEDPRTMAEMCTKWCANAEANGCPDISGSSCMPTCERITVTGTADCLRLYKNHSGCLADVPNVCDGDLRDELCLGAYCEMRRACELPDSRCR